MKNEIIKINSAKDLLYMMNKNILSEIFEVDYKADFIEFVDLLYKDLVINKNVSDKEIIEILKNKLGFEYFITKESDYIIDFKQPLTDLIQNDIYFKGNDFKKAIEEILIERSLETQDLLWWSKNFLKEYYSKYGSDFEIEKEYIFRGDKNE